MPQKLLHAAHFRRIWGRRNLSSHKLLELEVTCTLKIINTVRRCLRLHSRPSLVPLLQQPPLACRAAPTARVVIERTSLINLSASPNRRRPLCRGAKKITKIYVTKSPIGQDVGLEISILKDPDNNNNNNTILPPRRENKTKQLPTPYPNSASSTPTPVIFPHGHWSSSPPS